ncbi:hypothetical protein EDD22DRAFT_848236 [Suillus occidentalis]|nr:hypothetical protein EDD22DRAFT_848236 [Suillus occidentalis]
MVIMKLFQQALYGMLIKSELLSRIFAAWGHLNYSCLCNNIVKISPSVTIYIACVEHEHLARRVNNLELCTNINHALIRHKHPIQKLVYLQSAGDNKTEKMCDVWDEWFCLEFQVKNLYNKTVQKSKCCTVTYGMEMQVFFRASEFMQTIKRPSLFLTTLNAYESVDSLWASIFTGCCTNTGCQEHIIAILQEVNIIGWDDVRPRCEKELLEVQEVQLWVVAEEQIVALMDQGQEVLDQALFEDKLVWCHIPYSEPNFPSLSSSIFQLCMSHGIC